jgi:pimeloyl-ACP methyl ester carboxylesterase
MPLLVAGGYRVVAPDLRGFGESDAPEGARHYRADHSVADVVRLLDKLGIAETHLVGHDWGTVIGWLLAGHHPERIRSFTALSVGHPTAYARAGWEQKRKGWYTLFFQIRGLTEHLLSANGFARFRRFVRNYPECDHWILDLSRPGRLTAALNWYRGNLFTVLFGKHPRCPVPTLGIWSTRDFALTEEQMTASANYVDADWHYVRMEGLSHWIPLEAPEELSRLILDFIADAQQSVSQGLVGSLWAPAEDGSRPG